MTVHTVLIANRGEIARRIVRTCRETGVRAVAVFTDLDAGATFVREADHAVRVPSYLDAAAIVAAAQDADADAVHPGYGFLSENADFARAVTAAGLTFIGPSAEVIEVMGRKDRAREIADRAGVPVMPRFDPEAVPADAYPVLVKAAAGGGGKGMHVVRSAGELADALSRAQREALSAFGDDTLLIEQYVEDGRHVEVQVFGDHHGNVVHLFERDCSVQRRHQKIVEEAPAPGLSDALRRTLHESSVSLCREVGYANAGTVEFLVSGDRAFFLEMNTRLQVEHPVTEEITGIDLVGWQLGIAAGEPLPLTQDEIVCSGHAIEARVYAEDPYAGFLPQAGEVVDVHWPVLRRTDAAFEGAATVSTAYDPMLAKIIVRGRDRKDAIRELLAALDDTGVFGVTTNLGFVRRLVASPQFADAEIHTAWLDAHTGPLVEALPVPSRAIDVAAAALWPVVDDGWRSAGPAAPLRRIVVDEHGERHSVAGHDDPLVPRHVRGPRAWVTVEGQTHVFERPDGMRRPRTAAAGDAEILSPMPGTVLSVSVAEGDRVDAGQVLGVVEAMKMELSLAAAHDGTVTFVGAEAGDQVPLGHRLFHVEPTAD